MEGNPIASAAINEELKLLLEEGELCQEVDDCSWLMGCHSLDLQVDEYWSFKEKDNFAKYCHPMRNGKRIQFNEVPVAEHCFSIQYITQVHPGKISHTPSGPEENS